MCAEARNRPGVRQVQVDAAHAGRRVDNFVNAALGGVPRGRLYRMLRRGEVRVDGGRVKPDYRLQTGQTVRLPPFDLVPGHAGAAPAALAERLAAAVVYEDEDVLVLDKPAGVAVHGGSGIGWGVIETLRACRADGERLDLVHRLDRDTSGCLVLARDPRRLRALHEALRQGKVYKRYLALVGGHWRGGVVDSALRRVRGPGGERRVHADAGGKAARSTFKAIGTYPGATLVEVVTDSGRTHQIRVHAAGAGHPLAGDPRYGDPDLNRRLRALGLQRLFLHAASLRLPAAGGEIVVHAPLPPELRAVLDRLETAAAQRC